MKNNIVFCVACSAAKVDRESAWFQTFPPYGEYPVGGTIKDAKKDAKFIFNEATARRILDAFKASSSAADWPGILVDREHFSCFADKETDAMAWAVDIRQEDDGSIWTKWEWTPKGKDLYDSKTLINRSPAFETEKKGNDYYPVRLISIGMTNTPHFTELSTLAAARAAGVNKNPPGVIPMDKIIEALGLGEGASEDEILSAIQTLKDKATAAEAKATEAEKSATEEKAKCRALECDNFIAENKDKIADVAACREVFMESPDTAKKMLAACKVAKPVKPQTILAAAKSTPEAGKPSTFATCREEMASLPANERAAFYAQHKADIDAGK